MEGLQSEPALPEPMVSAARINRRTYAADASIILVGCYGAGKRTLGFIAAKYLGRRLLTEDHYFEQFTGCTRATFLQKYGVETFNRQVAIVLNQIFQNNRLNCVIECHTATLTPETQGVLATYAETNPVVYIHRDKEDQYRILKPTGPGAERILKNDQKHRVFCNLEFFNLLDTSGDGRSDGDSPLRSASVHSARLIYARQDFTAFLDKISGQAATRSWIQNPMSVRAIPPEFRLYTFVLSLRLSVLLETDINWTRLEAPGEAVELTIDTWPDNVLDIISTQVALIRRQLDVPIIYNVEENPREERRRPLEERDATDYELMLHGLRLGVDYLSLDLERSDELISRVLQMRGRTKIIGNFVVRGFGAPQWNEEVHFQRYLRGKALGCHIVRISRFCAGNRADGKRQILMDRIAALPDPKPHIVAYDYSVFGIVSPFQGLSLNPCGHEALEKTGRELFIGMNTTRGSLRSFFQRGWLQPLNFCVVGANVHYSASPSMHRAAYEHYMMPHSYEIRRCSTVEELNRIRQDPNFGGASLTSPFKVVMMDHCDHISLHATAIGAVNTILPLRGKSTSILDHANSRNQAGVTDKLYGENFDWSAIFTCLRRAISPRNSVQPSRTTALIIGAGGMARAAIYALTQLGCRKIFIFNRTLSRAHSTAAHFNKYAKEQKLTGRGEDERICYVINSASDPWPSEHQQPTMILSCIPASGVDDKPTVDFRMPSQWLRSPTGGVVIELAYEPLLTPLVVQIRKLRDEGNSTWIIIDGLEVVSEMAMEQFELYTGRNAPRKLMRRVCNDQWTRQCAPFQPQRLG